MKVEPINGYFCMRCEVEGMLDTTKSCWSCGQTDQLCYHTPFVYSSCAQSVCLERGMLWQQFESLLATCVDNEDGVLRDQSAL